MTAWQRNIPFFQREIQPAIDLNPVEVLEIGSYQGMSTRWMLDNLLQHPKSHITCIDIWESSEQHLGADFSQVEAEFDQQVEPHRSKVTKLKGDSWSQLLQLNLTGQKFDLIYVDGDHSAQGVLRDLVLAWPLLKVNGIMVCDDYVWKENLEAWGRGFRDFHSPLETPKMAIDAFTLIFSDSLRHWISYNLYGIVAFMKIK